jgi:putative oxygen-independent coproporphyrinogen III oxidase
VTSNVTSGSHSALYLSVPFCRTKCSFCNFASGVFSRERLERYVAHLEQAIAGAPALAAGCGAAFDPRLDSIYLGGGTPSILSPAQFDRLFAAIAATFEISPDAEITVEVAPGTLSLPSTPTAGAPGTPPPDVLAALRRAGVNRVSLGVQSFVDQEARSVGRLHTREIALDDIRRLREAGIANLSVDLIAGLPHQTAESWERSLDQTIALALPHVSVYMLEVDADSRLGRELIAGGTRYHAHHVPDEALTVALYERACQRLNAAGVAQYEISNFARAGHESRHNLRYWRRLPYFGFGVDAHSMLPAPTAAEPHRAVRLATPDSLEAVLAPEERRVPQVPRLPLALTWESKMPAVPGAGSAALPPAHAAGSAALPDLSDGAPHLPQSADVGLDRTIVSESQAIEETYFLGLRMNRGVELLAIKEEFGIAAVDDYREPIAEMVSRDLLALEDGWLRLTAQGRLLSNEVFAAFLRD